MNRRERRAEWLAARRGGHGAHASPRGAGLADAPLRLQVNEVVLHGFNPRERYALGDAIQQELSLLLADRGLPGWLAGAGVIERLDGGAFAPAPDSRPLALGAEVARAVYRGLEG